MPPTTIESTSETLDGAAEPPSPNREHRRSTGREHKRICTNRRRRQQYIEHVSADDSVVRSAIPILVALLAHSDELAGPVWPSQRRIAEIAGVDVRTVQRRLAELREAGYLLVFVSEPRRDHVTGRYSRRKTNRYYFTFCKTPGSGQRVRRNGRSHLPDTDDSLNPQGFRNRRPFGTGGGSLSGDVEDKQGLSGQAVISKILPSPPGLPMQLNVKTTIGGSGHREPGLPPRGDWSDHKGCNLCDHTLFILDASGLATRCSCS